MFARNRTRVSVTVLLAFVLLSALYSCPNPGAGDAEDSHTPDSPPTEDPGNEMEIVDTGATWFFFGDSETLDPL